MATGTAHQITGTATGVLAAASGFHAGVSPYVCALIVAGAAVAAKAPDYLEGGMIRHRTVTHWWVWWALLIVLGLHAFSHGAPLIGGFLGGFGIGGLTHLLFDLPNPAGIPLLTPYRRVSLKWWRSGRHEWLIVPAWLGATLYPAFSLFH